MRDEGLIRKMVYPKHAHQALKDIKAKISGFTYHRTYTPVALLLAKATINGIVYEGRGPSNLAAETKAYDKALCDIMVAKLTGQKKAQEENREPTAEEEVPILTLASYAIHWIFADWEAQGYCMKCGGAKSLEPIDPCTCNGAVASIAHLLKREDGSEAGPLSDAHSSKAESAKGEPTSGAGSTKSSLSAVAAGKKGKTKKIHDKGLIWYLPKHCIKRS